MKSHRALISLILEHDLFRKVCNFSGSCSSSRGRYAAARRSVSSPHCPPLHRLLQERLASRLIASPRILRAHRSAARVQDRGASRSIVVADVRSELAASSPAHSGAKTVAALRGPAPLAPWPRSPRSSEWAPGLPSISLEHA